MRVDKKLQGDKERFAQKRSSGQNVHLNAMTANRLSEQNKYVAANLLQGGQWECFKRFTAGD